MTAAFSARVDAALADRTLKLAIERTTGTARAKRAAAVAAWPQFEAARDLGRDIKDHVIANLGFYLAEFERNAKASGAQVHWARTAQEACDIVVGICRDAGAKSAERAANLDIRDPYVHLYSRIAGYGHLGAGRHDQAADWFLRADQLAPGLPPNLAALVVSRWLARDEEGARLDLSRLLQEEPGFRIGQMHPLPYRDPSAWIRFVTTLREAGAPE